MLVPFAHRLRADLFASLPIRRSSMFVVKDWQGALAAVVYLRPVSVIVDVEPLVARWNTDAAELAAGTRRTIGELSRLNYVAQLVFVTNSTRETPVISLGDLRCTYVSAAGKPWKARLYRGLERPICVLGDQTLTDGLLALRLSAYFVHVTPRVMPCWPRLQSFATRPIEPLFFRAATVTTRGHHGADG